MIVCNHADMWLSALIAVGAAGALQSAGPPIASPPPLIAFTNANLFDGVSDRPRRGVTILIEGRHIRAIQSSRITVPRGARIIDLKGAWALPGLVDAHVHLRDLESAQRALRAGVTTARSLGVDGFVDVDMAEQHEAGNKGLPDVIAAGYHVRPLPSERFFADFPELSHLKAGVSGPEDVRALVRANAGRRVKFIKVMATQRAGTVDADFRQRALTDSELVAAVSEARRNGLSVAAHAHTDDGVRAAVSVGAKTIEHGTEASVPTLRMMRTQRACLIPTLSFWADMASPGGEYDHPVLAHRARTMLPLAKLMVARARREAVMIAAGSDMRYDRTSSFSIADELMLMQDSGLSTFEALRAGTSSAAACLGVGARTGSLRAGMEADLLIVGGNPLKNLAQLKRPRLVINDGTIVEH